MAGSQISIRQLTGADLETFKFLRLEALMLEPLNFASSYDDWLEFPDTEWLKRLENPVFACFIDQEPVGLMGLWPEHYSKMAHRASVNMVYVKQAWRGKGVAHALLNHVIAHATHMGLRQLELLVSAENPKAIALYQAAGFVEIGRIPMAFIHHGKEIDDVMMARRL